MSAFCCFIPLRAYDTFHKCYGVKKKKKVECRSNKGSLKNGAYLLAIVAKHPPCGGDVLLIWLGRREEEERKEGKKEGRKRKRKRKGKGRKDEENSSFPGGGTIPWEGGEDPGELVHIYNLCNKTCSPKATLSQQLDAF